MSYLGSKAASGAYQAIIGLMPPHETYIESHLGSGTIMARKPPALKNIGIDIDPDALAFARSEHLAGYIGDLVLHQGCAHEFLSSYPFQGNELIYCDPPYLQSTRTSHHRYAYEYDEEDHNTLLDILRSVNASVLVSGYPSKHYDKMLPGWNTHEFQVMSRGGVRTEKVWFNYELDSLHWASFAGHNFTRRQQIKRKASRWAKSYKSMQPAERIAILSAMLQVDAEACE